MSADREQLIELFDSKVQSFASPEGVRFHALLPFKEGIIRLRAKKASCRTIVALLKELGVTVSHQSVARFCRELCPPTTSNKGRRLPTKQAVQIKSKPQPPPVAEILSRRHRSGRTSDTASDLDDDGPRIADPKNV
jgi:hypothetical protein